MTGAVTQFVPSAVLHVNLDAPLEVVDPPHHHRETAYGNATLLVFSHKRPIGTLKVSVPPGGLSPDAVATAIWSALKTEIAAHYQADGVAAPTELTAAGLGPDQTASQPCWANEPTAVDAPMVSIVIATKDRTAELQSCVSALLELDYPNFEIVVVDNGATTNDTANMIADNFADEPRVRYISEQRAGTSGARNRGVAESKGSIIAFTDDDVVVDRNWLRALAYQFAINPTVDCVTGLVFPAAFETPSQQWFEEYGGFNKGYKTTVFGRERKKGYTLLYPYTAGGFGSGNNAAFRREVFDRNGGFDTNLGPGTPARAGEDLDMFLDVIMNNRHIAYEPAAVISHFHRADYEGLRHQLFNYGIGLTAIFTKWSLSSWKCAFEIARRFPLGVWTVLDPRSPKNNKKSASFPSELGFEEIKGMLLGPFAYAKSVATARKRL